MFEIVEISSGGTVLQGRLHLTTSPCVSQPALVVVLTGDSPSGTKSKTWPPMIERFLSHGLSVFALDFHGQGFSGGSRRGLTLSVGRQNVLDAYAVLASKKTLEEYRIGFLGSSFGAAVLLSAYATLPKCDAIAFKSPASFLVESYEREHGFGTGMDEWRDTGVSVRTGLAYRAYLDAIRHNLYADAMNISCPVMIVHGDADEIVPIAQSRRLLHLLHRHASMVELPGVGHDYKSPEAQQDLQEHICAFFENVLLPPCQ